MVRVIRLALAAALVCLLASSGGMKAASHREAPLTALDRAADITDFYAFVSYDDPNMVTLIMGVDPLLEPANGPNYFPFDDDILYSIKVDSNNDALEDITFEFRFTTEIRLPGVPVGLIGAGGGVPAPANSPPPVAPGTPLIPPAITALDGPGSEGLSLRQRYTVTMVRGGGGVEAKRTTFTNGTSSGSLFAVPSNVGPRTMPDYPALAQQGIYTLNNGAKVFAGTTDDAFWIDLGATFDSLNLRVIPDQDVNGVAGFGSTGLPGVLTDDQDSADTNFVSDTVSGYNVNHIAIQVPIHLLTSAGPDSGPVTTIGTWSTTSRRRVTIRQNGRDTRDEGPWSQVQRMANPLFNELIIGTGSKDLWSRSKPRNDSQFADFALDPLIARAAQAAYSGAFDIPAPPRLDLLPLVTYAPPIAPAGTPAGPIADLLRLNITVPATSAESRSRLGVIGGDNAGFPNGRRVFDDVTDIALRVVVGGVLTVDANGASLNRFPNNRLGDGVNVNDADYLETFPYVGYALDGRNRRHRDPGEPGGGPIN